MWGIRRAFPPPHVTCPVEHARHRVFLVEVAEAVGDVRLEQLDKQIGDRIPRAISERTGNLFASIDVKFVKENIANYRQVPRKG